VVVPVQWGCFLGRVDDCGGGEGVVG